MLKHTFCLAQREKQGDLGVLTWPLESDSLNLHPGFDSYYVCSWRKGHAFLSPNFLNYNLNIITVPVCGGFEHGSQVI